jgi:hypothetical protein
MFRRSASSSSTSTGGLTGAGQYCSKYSSPPDFQTERGPVVKIAAVLLLLLLLLGVAMVVPMAVLLQASQRPLPRVCCSQWSVSMLCTTLACWFLLSKANGRQSHWSRATATTSRMTQRG